MTNREDLIQDLDRWTRRAESELKRFSSRIAEDGVTEAIRWCGEDAMQAEAQLGWIEEVRKATLAEGNELAKLPEGLERRLLGWRDNHSSCPFSDTIDRIRFAALRDTYEFLRHRA